MVTAGSFRAGGLFIFVKEMINIAIKLATSITYTADGSQTNFSIPFDYLRPSFVHVAVNDAEVSEGFTVSNRGIMFDTAPAKDALVKIYRKTPTSRLVSWADASILKAIDMTIAEVQQLHILEEASDWSKTNSIVLDEEGNTWQGRNCRMSNIADPTEAQDVVTKHYLDNEEGSFTATMNALKTKTEEAASTAETNAKQAQTSATNAKTSETNAKTSATNAKTSETNAKTSETNAKTSETNAKTSETNANASKEAAQSAANSASNFATDARSSASEAKSYRDAASIYATNAKNYSENVNVFVPSVSTDGVLSWSNKAGLTNPASVNIKGAKGDTGTAASIKIGSVTTGAAGSNASVTNSGTASNVVLNFTLPRGKDGGVTVDAELSDTSTNPVQNKAIYNALLNKVGTDILSGFALLGGGTQIRWREGTQFIGAINAVKYSGTARAATLDGDGNKISTTYAKKTDISGMVKSVNNIKPDSNGNVTIEVSGSGISTSESNTWTAEQIFYALMLNREKYTTYVVNGTSDTPIISTMVYAVTDAFTLDLATLAGTLSASQSSVFTAYFAANADYSLTISNAGNLKYVGSASDVAITSAGLLLNIMMLKDASGNLTSIIQASKLEGGA